MSEIGNQQVTKEELGWLAGIIDGEGTIGMRYHYHKNKPKYRVELGIINTCPILLEKVFNICRKLGVNLHVQGKGSNCWQTQTLKYTDLNKILTPLLSLLSTKYKRSRWCLAFVNRRLILSKRSKSKATNSIPYNKTDKWYFDKFRELFMNKPIQSPHRLSFTGVEFKRTRSA